MARTRPGGVSRALARDRLGVPAVLFFVLAGVAPLTVAAGVIPTAFQTTGLTGIPAAFLVVAVVLAVFAVRGDDQACHELVHITGGRTDLLARCAGERLARHENLPGDIVHERAAQLCITAGADMGLIERWRGESRPRGANRTDRASSEPSR